MCAVTIAVQHLLCSGDRGGTTTFQRRRHHSVTPAGTSTSLTSRINEIPVRAQKLKNTVCKLRQGCVLSPLLFNIFFAAVIEVVLQRFSEDDTILENLVFLDEGSGGGPDETLLDLVRRAVWGMLYADDAGIVSRSPAGLARMMTVIVEVFGAFGLTVSEKKMETLLMRAPEKAQQPGETPTPPLLALEIAAAGQKYHQVHQFVYLGGLITEDADITRDIDRRIKIAWGCLKFSTELFDRPSASLRLKARLLKAEAMEALLYGCMTWAPRNAHYRQVWTTHHKAPSAGYRVPPRSRHISKDVVR